MKARLRWIGAMARAGCAALDRQRWAGALVVCLGLFLFSLLWLSQAPVRSLASQTKRLNPDARLYWGLAQNLLSGVGYQDTVRNHEIIPSIGHPGLLALAWRYLGWTPAQFTQMTVWLATALTIWAVFRYTRSATIALLAFVLTAVWLPHIEWLVGNVESSTVLATSVLIAALAELYRQRRWRWGVLVGIALGLHLLARPVLLYPVHAVALGAVVMLIVPAWRRRLLRPRLPRTAHALLLAVFVAEGIIGAVRVSSEVSYGDSRLVTGTYGAWPLYGGNALEHPPDATYSRKPKSRHWVRHARQIMDSYGEPPRRFGWQERQRVLLSEVFAYWRSHPIRALWGYEWRLRRLLGLNEDAFATPLGAAHAGLTVALTGLTALNVRRRSTRWGLGTLLAGLALLYAGIHALFLWAGIRYAAPLFPFLTAGVSIAFHEAFYGRRLSVARGLLLRRRVRAAAH